MKIKQIIVGEKLVYIFTENPKEDLKILIDKYENGTSKVHLGYETPELSTFNFLGKDYPCISLWFDNEDIPYFYTSYKAKQ